MFTFSVLGLTRDHKACPGVVDFSHLPGHAPAGVVEPVHCSISSHSRRGPCWRTGWAVRLARTSTEDTLALRYVIFT